MKQLLSSITGSSGMASLRKRRKYDCPGLLSGGRFEDAAQGGKAKPSFSWGNKEQSSGRPWWLGYVGQNTREERVAHSNL